MDQSGDVDQDLRELIRSDLREIVAQQKTLEEKIVLLLLPRDPNDDRNVMLEIRAGSYIYDRIYIVHTVTYICTYMHAFAHNNTTIIIHIDMTTSSARNVHTHSS